METALGEAPALFASCDLAIYPFEDGLVNRTKSPAKLLALLAAILSIRPFSFRAVMP